MQIEGHLKIKITIEVPESLANEPDIGHQIVDELDYNFLPNTEGVVVTDTEITVRRFDRTGLKMITLKKVKIVDSLSEETICFSADVYENDTKIGTAKNYGLGGLTQVYFDTPKNATDQQRVSDAVDEIIEEMYKQKQISKIQKQLERNCIKYVCVGWINEHGACYYTQGFKPVIPLAELVKYPNGLAALQKMVDRIKGEITGDEKILNTNLEALGVKI